MKSCFIAPCQTPFENLCVVESYRYSKLWMASEVTDYGRTQGPGDQFSALIPAWEVEKKGVFTLETIGDKLSSHFVFDDQSVIMLILSSSIFSLF